MNKKEKTKSALAWVLEFTKMDAASYFFSVLFAIISVAAGFLPYYFVARIVGALIEENKDIKYYLIQCGFICACWIGNKLFHAFSTTMSHKATFGVLAQIRRMLTKKLSRMPLGDVMDDSSGSLKNIIVERVDSVETTLAHIVPELISNAIVPVGVLIIMLTINWKLTLLAMISIPVGGIFYSLMMVGAKESFENTNNQNNSLNNQYQDLEQNYQ